MLEWAFVALGSNLGDRLHNLALGRRKLAGLVGTAVVAESRVEETEPVGGVAQGDFLNQMVLLRTERSAEELLRAGHEAEREAGRVPSERWGPRALDVDIVRFGDHIIREPHITVPHPELPHRPFWLRELAELLPHVTQLVLPVWAQVGPKRRGHILRVAALVETWAIAMSRTPDERSRWVRAALGHDAVRDAPPEDLARWADGKWGIPALYHGAAAAHVARDHGETDPGVLDAMTYHSVGYVGWDEVGRMLFMADCLEPGRKFRRQRRAALAAQVPDDPAGVLAHVVRMRLKWALKHRHPILPEGAEFWNDVLSS